MPPVISTCPICCLRSSSAARSSCGTEPPPWTQSKSATVLSRACLAKAEARGVATR